MVQHVPMKSRGSYRTLAQAVVLAVVAGTLVTAAQPATAQVADAAADQLHAQLDSILSDPALNGAKAGVVVVDTTTGETLYRRDGADRLMPASNRKLLTSTAAMDILGPEFRFTTEVKATAWKTGPVLAGDLFLRGTGDPTMLASDYDALATQIAASGVRLVTGSLVADDTWFDDTRLGQEWSWEDEPYYYAAQVSALNVAPDTDYDTGSIIATAGPAATAGAKPVVTLDPATDYVRIDNRATTVVSGSDTLTITRQHGTNTIVVTGQVPVDGGQTAEWLSVSEPTGYAADVFRRALQAHGVRVLGPTTLGQATPAGARSLASHQSMPLSQMYIPFLKLSSNAHAEVLAKSIGRAVSGSGTWDAGLAAIAVFATANGVNMNTIAQADGSGLSRRNLIPPDEITDLLLSVRTKSWFPIWYNALPIAGNPDRMVGGTLRSRMRNTPAANNVHAKTGSFTGANALSGYVTDADGHQLVFSIVINNQLPAVSPVQDRIVVALASFSRSAASARIAVPAAPTVPAVSEVPGGLECSWVKPIRC